MAKRKAAPKKATAAKKAAPKKKPTAKRGTATRNESLASSGGAHGHMTPLPAAVTDAELIAFIDRWAALLEREDYEAAFALTDQIAELQWTPALVRAAIKNFGDVAPSRHVTLEGVATDWPQRKEVSRFPTNAHGFCGEILYDLNIDGKLTDLSATFRLKQVGIGITVLLQNINVM